jgi:hypothetical protein
MKRLWVAAVLVVLALWLGYDLGYHRGTREERAAWEATETVEMDMRDGPPMIRSKPSGLWLTNQAKLSGSRLLVYYTDPRFSSGFIIGHSGPTPVNLPDPRNTPVK